MSASPMSKIPVAVSTREQQVGNSLTGNNNKDRDEESHSEESSGSSDEDSSPPPIPPTKPPAKNPKEKTIEALNIIYARKPTPSTISTSSFAPGDERQRPIIITTSTTSRNDTEIVKNLPPVPPGPGNYAYASGNSKGNKTTPVPIPLNISPSPTRVLAPAPLPGLWFNMTDEYPVENFSGRESILEEIETVVKGVKSRDARPISRAIILLGEPSVGKTEIARKFAFKFYVSFDGCANVVWINASSQETIKETLLQLDDFELRQRLQKASRPQSPLLLNNSGPGTGLDQLQISGTDDERPKSPVSPSSMVRANGDDDDDDSVEYQPSDQAIKSKSPPPKSPSIKKNNSSFKLKPSKKQQQNQFDDLDNDARIESVLRNPIFQELPTLFVFDDAKREEDVIKYLPKLSPVGHIPNCLITSSTENEGYWNNSRIIKVPSFDISDAVHFLLESFKDIPEFTRNQAHWLAKELHYFPPLLQRARKMVLQNLTEGSDSVQAMSRLEQNVGLVRRMNAGVIEHKELEIAVLNVDRGNYFGEDPYIREFEGEIRTHPLALRLHQLEAILPSVLRQPELTILAINEEAYIMSILSHLAGPFCRIIGAYDNENYGEETIADQTLALNKDNPDLLKRGRIELRLVETPRGKGAKKSKITQVLEKLRAVDGKLQYNIILTSLYADSDFTPVKRLLHKDGRFVTSMSSSNVSLALKKVDSKKLEIKILKKDFPELLVNVHKL